jgi:hypothetical protein
MNNLGLAQLVADLEGLISSCKVTELPYNRNWTGPGGLCIAKSRVHDRLNDIGITDGLYRARLCREVWV